MVGSYVGKPKHFMCNDNKKLPQLNNMVLAPWQTRTIEQNSEARNKPKQIWPTNFDKENKHL